MDRIMKRKWTAFSLLNFFWKTSQKTLGSDRKLKVLIYLQKSNVTTSLFVTTRQSSRREHIQSYIKSHLSPFSTGTLAAPSPFSSILKPIAIAHHSPMISSSKKNINGKLVNNLCSSTAKNLCSAFSFPFSCVRAERCYMRIAIIGCIACQKKNLSGSPLNLLLLLLYFFLIYSAEHPRKS